MKLYLNTCTKDDIRNYIQEQIAKCEDKNYEYNRTFYWLENHYADNPQMHSGVEYADEQDRFFEINTNSGITEMLYNDPNEGNCYITTEKLVNIVWNYLENNYR